MIQRRTFLQSIGSAALMGAVCGSSRALAERRILPRLRIVAPGAVGGGYDSTARSIEAALRATGAIGSAQISNVPGAGGTVGLAQFAKQYSGEGDALLVTGSTMVSSIIANKSPIDLSATTPIARLVGSFNAIAVPAGSPFKDARDLMAAFKEKPSSVVWCGGSVGGGDHMIVGMLAEAAGVDAKNINYVAYAGGGEVLAAVLGGHVTAALSGWSEFKDQFKAGKLRCLGITADRAFPGVDAPTLTSLGINVVFYGWGAVTAAPGITEEQRSLLAGMIDEMAHSQVWKDELEKRGLTDLFLSGAPFQQYVKDQAMQFRATLARLGLA